MRIIGGEFKGRRFDIVKGFKGRPTTDFAKEGLFNVLSNMIDWSETDVLDLFAGTGAITIECASRGAKSALAIEKDRRAVYHLEKIIDSLEIDAAFASSSDAFFFLEKNRGSFDLIFADPPFSKQYGLRIHELVFQGSALREGGLLIIEHEPHEELSNLAHWQQTRKYGKVHFSFFRKSDSQ